METSIKPSREERQLKKHLKELTETVGQYLRRLDSIMVQHSKGIMDNNELGKQIAILANALEYANDQARYFGLSIDYRNDGKRKKLLPKHNFHALTRAIQERDSLLAKLEELQSTSAGHSLDS